MYFRILYTFIVMLIAIQTSLSQVVLKELLEKDHKGSVIKSNTDNKEELKYEWLFQSIDGVKSMYKLRLSDDSNSKEFDVRVRNLITTMYIAVRLTNNDGKVTTLTSIYDKGDKWQRVKMSPVKECLTKDADWLRYNHIKSLDELLNNIIAQMDTNLVLTCFM